MANFGKKYTVGEFFELTDYKNIRIPILQRDYAQGRPDKGYIRVDFLKDIRNTIENNEKLTLDFVYGYSDDEKRFYPLDGQQRLTTIWLIYWYLSLKAGKLAAERDKLIKFSYETRKTSRSFCESLCKNSINNPDNKSLVNSIVDQEWFFEIWKEDPTIKSMLIMLGGISDNDGIDPCLKNLTTEPRKWRRYLRNFKNLISFYVLDLNKESTRLPEETADQLYVKMNARGKALTDFENFKADLKFHMNKLAKDGKIDKIKPELLLSKFDQSQEWNELFWKSADAGNNDGITDEIFFAFVNRFCFSRLCITKKDLFTKYVKLIDEYLSVDVSSSDNEDLPPKISKLSSEERNKLFQDKETGELLRTYSYLSDDQALSYESYSYYEQLLDADGLKNLENTLNGVKKHINDIEIVLKDINSKVKVRLDTSYKFLPSYSYDEKTNKKKKRIDKKGHTVGEIKDIKDKDRCYFFAVCKYFEVNYDSDNGQDYYNKEKFNDWMRFSRNIIENARIESATATINCKNNF